jgi:hypothetical protein
MDFLIVCATCHQTITPGVAHEHSAPLHDTQQREHAERGGHYAVVQTRVAIFPAPGAGVDAVAVVPSNVRWEVQNLSGLLTTDAAVANRVPHLIVDDGQGNQVYNYPAPANQAASLAVQYTAGIGSVNAAFDNSTVLVLPSIMHLSPGWRIGFKTTALDGGDQWTKFALLVKEWLSF